MTKDRFVSELVKKPYVIELARVLNSRSVESKPITRPRVAKSVILNMRGNYIRYNEALGMYAFSVDRQGNQMQIYESVCGIYLLNEKTFNSHFLENDEFTRFMNFYLKKDLCI